METNRNLTAPEVLAVAIKAEVNAENIYKAMAERVRNELVKEKLLNLSNEEKKHENMLRSMYKQITNGQEPVLQSKGISEVEDFLKGNYTHEAALEMAIQSEEKAEKFYLDAAQNSEDPNGRFMFEYLANFERGHKVLLQNELDALKRNPHWFDDQGLPWKGDAFHVGP